MPPRAAYVHVPFCARRCGYCNFALVAGRGDLVPAYLEAVEKELATQHESPQQVDTLYFGGGTPTQLGMKAFEQLARLAQRWYPLAENYEWTVEANPADLNDDFAALLARLGVNRLSLGGQSFRAEKLRVLERDHSPEDIERSVALAATHGLAISLDLMFAAPGETLDQWRLDLQRAVGLQPTHVSVYGLTFEKGTTFWNRLERGELDETNEELQRAMYLEAIDRLGAAGIEQYEISNFARPGARSRHNETYWRGDEYFAVGPGAARYVAGVRETNHRSTATYLRRVLAGESPVAEREQLDAESRARERLVFALRRIEGVDRGVFREATGFDVEQLAGQVIAKFVDYGLLDDDGQQVRLARDGLLVSDAMWPEML